MKVRLTAVSTGPGTADIIAHVPAQGDTVGYRAVVARAWREDSGQWRSRLYAKAHKLGEPEPEHKEVSGFEQGLTRGHLVEHLIERGIWWTA